LVCHTPPLKKIATSTTGVAQIPSSTKPAGQIRTGQMVLPLFHRREAVHFRGCATCPDTFGLAHATQNTCGNWDAETRRKVLRQLLLILSLESLGPKLLICFGS